MGCTVQKLSPIETTEDQHIRIQVVKDDGDYDIYLKTKTLPFALIDHPGPINIWANGIEFMFGPNKTEMDTFFWINTNQSQAETLTWTKAKIWEIRGEQIRIGIAELNRRLQIRPGDDAIRFDDTGKWILPTPKSRPPPSVGSILE